jgi:hypothetical protein
MGDPLGAARHIRDALAADGTWLIVEPYVGDAVLDNLNPIGRIRNPKSLRPGGRRLFGGLELRGEFSGAGARP